MCEQSTVIINENNNNNERVLKLRCNEAVQKQQNNKIQKKITYYA